MITTVCLNPCIDRTIGISAFEYGGTNRVADLRNDAGGKGINVAVTAAQLGLEAACLSFLHKNGGSEIEHKLRAFGVHSAGVEIDGTLRTNIKLFDRSSGIVTEINESGAPVSEDDLNRMTQLILRHAQKSEFLILSGSVPPGCPSDYYRMLIEAVKDAGCRCILDADGKKLCEGLKALPYLIKPNLSELEGLLGRTLSSLDEVRDAALRLIEQGVSIIAVSMGSRGAIITDGNQSLFAPCLKVPVKSTVSAGDSMIAGLTAGFHAHMSLEDAFRMGIACASAAVMTEGTQPPEKDMCLSLIDQVQIRSI